MVATTKTKAWVSAAGMVATALTAAFADDVLNIGDVEALGSALIVAGIGVYSVYQAKNRPVDSGQGDAPKGEPWQF